MLSLSLCFSYLRFVKSSRHPSAHVHQFHNAAMAAVEGSSSKRQRQSVLAGFRHAGVTDAMLGRILSSLKSHTEVLEASGSSDRVRKDLSEFAMGTLASVAQAIELPMEDGSTFQWEFASPVKLLRLMLDTCAVFRDMFLRTTAAAVGRHEPLSIILYHDEFTPGQVLKPDNRRKTTSFYFTFAEFGDFIRSEYAWMTVAVLRHSISSHVVGGLSCATKFIMRSFFFGEENFFSGALLPLASPTIVFAKFACFIADESAIKHTYSCKGASGLLPCMKCKNVVLAEHGLVENDSGRYLVDILATSGFDFATDADIWQKFDMLAALHAGGATKAKVEQLEKATGFNLSPTGLLGDLDLRAHVLPITHTSYDPMHCIFSNGIGSQEMHLVLKLCSQHLGIAFSHLESWCGAWKSPAHTDSKVASAVFSSRREGASKDGFKGIASELVAIFPLVRHFIEVLVRPRCPEAMKSALESFSMLCSIVSLLNAMKRDRSNVTNQNCNKLQRMLASHLKLFAQAHGAEHVRPKHHFCQHLPGQILARGAVLDCWPCERKHRSLKRIAGTIDNTRNFERSLLARAVAEQISCTPAESFTTKLLGETTLAPDLAVELGANSVTLARGIKYGVVSLSAGDVIIAESTCIRITACMLLDSSWCVLAVVYEFVQKLGAGTLWKLQAPSACFTLSPNGFLVPTYWTFQSDGLLLTLLDE